MNPVSLTRKQQVEIDVLVSAGRLRKVLKDLAKAQRFLDQAEDSLEQISNLTSNQVSYDVAYNASHDVGEAILSAYGFRTGSGVGQHQVVGELLLIVFTGTPAQQDSVNFDALRGGRNGSRYEAKPKGKRDVDFAVLTAQNLLNQAREILRKGST